MPEDWNTSGALPLYYSDSTTASSPVPGKKSLLSPLISGQDTSRPGFKLAYVAAVLMLGIVIGAGTACVLLWPFLGQVPVSQGPYGLSAPPTAVPETYYAAKSFNNSILITNLASLPSTEGKPQTFDACGFVVRSTDEIWNKRDNVDIAIDKYFHEDYVDAGSWGRRIIGKKALKAAVWSEMRAFPDIQIHITDCACLGNDVDGYKCAMPDVLIGTNTGPSGYGPATGKFAKWTGMVESWVKQNPETGEWQYYAEWGVHDEWALIQQLGLDFSRVPHPLTNSEPLHDGEALLPFNWGRFTINNYDVTQQRMHDAQKLAKASA
jgi:hypothetical protein